MLIVKHPMLLRPLHYQNKKPTTLEVDPQPTTSPLCRPLRLHLVVHIGSKLAELQVLCGTKGSMGMVKATKLCEMEFNWPGIVE